MPNFLVLRTFELNSGFTTIFCFFLAGSEVVNLSLLIFGGKYYNAFYTYFSIETFLGYFGDSAGDRLDKDYSSNLSFK